MSAPPKEGIDGTLVLYRDPYPLLNTQLVFYFPPEPQIISFCSTHQIAQSVRVEYFLVVNVNQGILTGSFNTGTRVMQQGSRGIDEFYTLQTRSLEPSEIAAFLSSLGHRDENAQENLLEAEAREEDPLAFASPSSLRDLDVPSAGIFGNIPLSNSLINAGLCCLLAFLFISIVGVGGHQDGGSDMDFI